MTEAERREAARKFINHWRGKGDEKQDSQLFWVSLLQDVYGMENVKEHVQFERRVIVDGQQKYIDVYLPETRVMIEQKSMTKDLSKRRKISANPNRSPVGFHSLHTSKPRDTLTICLWMRCRGIS